MRKKSALTPILIGLVFIMAATIGLFIFKEYNDSKQIKYSYVSMTDEASARAYVWLNEIDDMPLSFDDVKECMGDFNLEIVLTPTEERGTYVQSLADGSYEYVENQAKTGFEKAYRLVVISRLKDSGVEGECTDETVDELMSKTFGVTVAEYLDSCEVELIPSKEKLESMYSGEVTNE